MSDTEILTGWKQIEAYLNLNRETILSRGFPIRRPDGASVNGVFALKSELVAHVRSMPKISVNIR